MSGIIGPEFENCKSKKPQFGIIDVDSKFVYFTAANNMNLRSPEYFYKENTEYLVYYKDGEELLGSDRIITVPPGVYDNT